MSSVVSFLVWVVQNPTSKEYAAISLGAAIVANFVLGNLIALVRGTWSLNRWGDVVGSKIDTRDMKVIFITIGGTLLTAITASIAGSKIDLSYIQQFILPAFLTAAGAESALYSTKIWYEDVQQLRDFVNALVARVTGRPLPQLRNLSQTASVHKLQIAVLPPKTARARSH